jgi:hypothetical protein
VVDKITTMAAIDSDLCGIFCAFYACLLLLISSVVVTLRDIDFRDPIPLRSITLRAPDWDLKIGRGTQSGFEGLKPARNNAWFDSRVMSRNHAVLRVDPTTRVGSSAPGLLQKLTRTRNCPSRTQTLCMAHTWLERD